MPLASQLRPGIAILFEGQRYRVTSAEYHPGQGKMGGATHARLQNLETGTFRELSLRGELKLQEVELEKRVLEFLYASAGQCCFMHPETYEQTEIPAALAGARARFLEPGMKLTVEFLEGRPVSILFPDFLEVKIADTAPPIHQQTDGAWKPAKLANGVEVMVPQFVKAGDTIRLDLTEMKYMDRVRADARARNA